MKIYSQICCRKKSLYYICGIDLFLTEWMENTPLIVVLMLMKLIFVSAEFLGGDGLETRYRHRGFNKMKAFTQ